MPTELEAVALGRLAKLERSLLLASTRMGDHLGAEARLNAEAVRWARLCLADGVGVD